MGRIRNFKHNPKRCLSFFKNIPPPPAALVSLGGGGLGGGGKISPAVKSYSAKQKIIFVYTRLQDSQTL